MDTTTEIQKFVKRQEVDEPIPDKSRDRVTRSVAESLKSTNPLDSGSCEFCSRLSDRLIPVTMKCCKGCVSSMLSRGGGMRVLSVFQEDNYCDKCLGRSFTSTHINPLVCIYCVRKIGRTHRYGGAEMEKNRQRNEMKKPYETLRQWRG